MSYLPTINLFVGDTAPDITFTLWDEVALANIDLTALAFSAVTMRFQPMAMPEASLDLVLVQTAPSVGEVMLVWGTTLVGIAPGAYEGEVRIEAAGGFKRTINERFRFQLFEPGGSGF